MLRELHKDITSITATLIECGLSVAQNYPKQMDFEVTWSTYSPFSHLFRSVSYSDAYGELESTRNYNIKLIDGGLLQLYYQVDSKAESLIQHRLAFLPNPALIRHDDAYEDYEEDSLFLEILDREVVPIPLRFDFDAIAGKKEDTSHPTSHFSIGGYENCRIPVAGPISPFLFTDFIIRNFYYEAFAAKKLDSKWLTKDRFDERTINSMEENLLYFNFSSRHRPAN